MVEVVYNENIEWVSSVLGTDGSVNFNSTVNPEVGLKCTRVTNITSNRRIRWTKPTVFDTTNISYLNLSFYLNDPIGIGKDIRIYTYLGSNPVGFVEATNYGLNRSIINKWQTVTIPTSVIAPSTNIDIIQIKPIGGATSDMYNFSVDYVNLVHIPSMTLVNSVYKVDEIDFSVNGLVEEGFILVNTIIPKGKVISNIDVLPLGIPDNIGLEIGFEGAIDEDFCSLSNLKSTINYSSNSQPSTIENQKIKIRAKRGNIFFGKVNIQIHTI